jgi:hypothetical protein
MVYSCLESVVNTSIVDNIANFKMQLIDGAATVSTVVNNYKIRFRKVPVILITFGRKNMYALEDLHCIKYECYSKISIQKYSRYPTGGLWFLDVRLYIHTPRMVVLISWDCQKSEINNSMTLEV